jgi:hypothetical protein
MKKFVFPQAKKNKRLHDDFMVKAKETKKCPYRDDDDDLVEFCQLWRRMRTLLCYGLSADAQTPAVVADWTVT